jgi:hypothetical protein
MSKQKCHPKKFSNAFYNEENIISDGCKGIISKPRIKGFLVVKEERKKFYYFRRVDNAPDEANKLCIAYYKGLECRNYACWRSRAHFKSLFY